MLLSKIMCDRVEADAGKKEEGQYICRVNSSWHHEFMATHAHGDMRIYRHPRPTGTWVLLAWDEGRREAGLLGM